jgi:hypothetical protein
MKRLALLLLLAAGSCAAQANLLYWNCVPGGLSCPSYSNWYVAAGSGNSCECGAVCNLTFPYPPTEYWISANAGYHLGPTGCPPYDPALISSAGGITAGSQGPNGVWASASGQSYYGSVWYSEYMYCPSTGPIYYGNPYSTLQC